MRSIQNILSLTDFWNGFASVFLAITQPSSFTQLLFWLPVANLSTVWILSIPDSKNSLRKVPSQSSSHSVFTQEGQKPFESWKYQSVTKTHTVLKTYSIWQFITQFSLCSQQPCKISLSHLQMRDLGLRESVWLPQSHRAVTRRSGDLTQVSWLYRAGLSPQDSSSKSLLTFQRRRSGGT